MAFVGEIVGEGSFKIIKYLKMLDNYVRNGAQEWNRTTDTAIFSRMLYQLSYLGIPSSRWRGRE